MVRIVEIAHGEAVGIGLAGSELPRRRARTTTPRDAGRARGTGGTSGTSGTSESAGGTGGSAGGRSTRARTLGVTVTYAVAIVVVVVAVRFAARAYGW